MRRSASLAGDASTNGHAARGRRSVADEPPPQALDSEQAMLACVLIDPAMIERVEHVGANDLYDNRNKLIYGAMLALHAEGLPIDHAGVVAQLRDASKYDAAGGAAYLAEVLSVEALASTIGRHAQRVVDAAARRRVIADALDQIEAARGGMPVARLARHATESADRLTRRLGGAALFPAVGPIQLLRTPPIEYLIPGILAVAQMLVLCGARKILKTSILIDLAVSLASGRPFLGYFRVERTARVMVLTGESGLPVIRETLCRVCTAAMLDPVELESMLYVSERLPRIDRLDELAALRTVLRDHAINVAVIDPAYLLFPADDVANMFAQGRLLGALNEAVTSAGAQLVLAHHTRKSVGQSFAPAELDDMSHAGFAEYARSWVLLSRRAKYEPGSGLHELWLSSGGSAGHGGLWGVDVSEAPLDEGGARRWDLTIRSADDLRDEATAAAATKRRADQVAREGADADRMLAALNEHPDGALLTVLRTSAGMSSERARQVLERLIRERLAEKCPVTSAAQKSPKEGYRPCAE